MFLRYSTVVLASVIMILAFPTQGSGQVTAQAEAGPDCNEKCQRVGTESGDWGYSCFPAAVGEGEGVGCVATVSGCNFGEPCPWMGAFVVMDPMVGTMGIGAHRSCRTLGDLTNLSLTELAGPSNPTFVFEGPQA